VGYASPRKEQGTGATVRFDFSIFSRVAEALIIAVLGGFIARVIERRPRVVVFYGHIGEFHLPPTQGNPALRVHTHTVVIRNNGRLAAHNVRVPHNLPLTPPLNFSVAPQTAFTRAPLAGGGEEITFSVLVPGEQITISYLYFAPLTFNQINLPIRSDEGLARAVNVLPARQFPRWLVMFMWGLAFVGSITVIYLLVELGIWIYSRLFP
jgi:hypothetical protein